MQQLEGILFFPVTPFDAAGQVNEDALAAHIARGLDHGPGGIFVACGTGELHALDADEHERVVRVAVQQSAGRVPVFAGVGGPAPMAMSMARSAERAGADGLLMLPPYLVDAPQEGLYAYARAVAAATELPVIAYHRGNSVYRPETAARIAELPNVIGIKDGYGDLDLLIRLMAAVRSALAGTEKPFQFFNGLPTAELTMPAYRGAGVTLYSSAVFAFAPEISLAFFQALTGGDHDRVETLLDRFFAPFVALRSLVPGYAVSLIKAGCHMRGLDVGGVRPPLTDPSAEHVGELERILDDGLSAVAGAALSGDRERGER